MDPDPRDTVLPDRHVIPHPQGAPIAIDPERLRGYAPGALEVQEVACCNGQCGVNAERQDRAHPNDPSSAGHTMQSIKRAAMPTLRRVAASLEATSFSPVPPLRSFAAPQRLCCTFGS